MMKTNKIVKLGIATFAVAVLGALPAFTAQADTNVAEQPNTASKPVENAKPSDSEKPEVKPAEEVKPEAESTANAAETQPSDAPREDATLNKEKHLPIRYVIELDFKDIRTGEEVEPTKTLTGTVNFGEDLTIDAPTFEGYRLERGYSKILNISYDILNYYGEKAGSESSPVHSPLKYTSFTLTKEGDTIVAHYRLEYETLPLEKPNRGERTLHISFSYTGTPKIMPDGTLPPYRKYHSIDEDKRDITVTIKPGESFTLPKGDIDGYILEDITDSRHEEGRWGATTGNHYKPGETVPYEKFNFYPAVVDGVESDHISVSYSYYRPAGYIGYEKPSQPTEEPGKPSDESKPDVKPSEEVKPSVPTAPSDQPQPTKPVKPAEEPSVTPVVPVSPTTPVKPISPVTPVVPDQPQPAKPEKPAEKPSEKPVVPDTPKPVTPVVPTVPTTPVTPTNPATPSTSRVLSNEAGSVQVRGSEATLKNVSYIKVEETKAKSLETKSYKAYNIHLYDANGKAIQPNGMVLVTLSADKPVENVYYVAPDGALQALDFKQDADKVTFETNHFSIYAMTFKNVAANRNDSSIQMPIAVVGGENTTTTAQNSNGADTTKAQATPLNTKTEGGSKALPNTGEQNSILGFAGFLLASLGLAGLTYKGRH